MVSLPFVLLWKVLIIKLPFVVEVNTMDVQLLLWLE